MTRSKKVKRSEIRKLPPVFIARCFLEYGQQYPCAEINTEKDMIEVLIDYIKLKGYNLAEIFPHAE